MPTCIMVGAFSGDKKATLLPKLRFPMILTPNAVMISNITQNQVECCARRTRRMIEISTYCQPTPWNDRLVSLLSAVLLNPIRPDFTRAINDKPSVSQAHRRSQDVVGVVILLPALGESESRACKLLRRRIKKFSTKYSLHVTCANRDQASKQNFVQTMQ